MDKFTSRNDLKARGLKATAQRLAVLGAVSRAEGYFTPQELYRTLLTENSSLGLVTVYRTLTKLAREGLICQIESTGRIRLYARRSAAHHHHLVCARCARVVEFNDCELKTLADRLARQTGFAVQSHRLEFQGICRNCSQVGRPASTLHKAITE